MSLPFVSVIVLTRDGKHFLENCLPALFSQTYPRDRYEVIVTDNGSTDGTLEWLREEWPCVRAVENGGNRGFCIANNAAIKIGRGDYFILLNNDTAPDPDWIAEMSRVAREREDCGIVAGRLVLFYDQLVVSLESPSFTPAGDGRALGVMVFGVESRTPMGVIQFLDGFHGWEPSGYDKRWRWTNGHAQLGVPIRNRAGDQTVRLKLATTQPDPVRVCVSVGGQALAEFDVSGREPKEYCVVVPEATIVERARTLVQNTGSLVFTNGAGRDRGTFVKHYEVFYKEDVNLYLDEEEVFAACGGNMLLKRAMLDDCGSLDDDFFIYYEDTDLSWRARLRGWTVYFSPRAVVRHIHSGTTKEWSPFFTFQVERNRLAMLAKNAPVRVAAREIGLYAAYIARDVAMGLRAKAQRAAWADGHLKATRIRAGAYGSLWKMLPALLGKRRRIQRGRTISNADLAQWFLPPSDDT